MDSIIAFGLDIALFVLAPWLLWRLTGRILPLAVLPILIGLLLALAGGPAEGIDVPSRMGELLGWAGVLLLAFTAGLETRHPPGSESEAGNFAARNVSAARIAATAGAALVLPFAVGLAASYLLLLDIAAWQAPEGGRLAGAAAIGLCLAVSALPVLVGITRELKPAERGLGQLALRVAVIDDAVLWIGLGLLLLLVQVEGGLGHWGWLDAVAILVAALLAACSKWGDRLGGSLPGWSAWPLALLALAAGSWASSELGLHSLIGAYLAGLALPPAVARHLPAERLGLAALIGLAPFFFGHRGLGIEGAVLGWGAMVAALGLLVLSATAKIAAVVLVRPSPLIGRREAMALGCLLQCKGLMEIVAATILRDQGLLSETAYAVLVALAILSTAMTGPLFRAVQAWRRVRETDGGSRVRG
ncbi:cation:proton antiporter [Telmatospirillum sp. J64-1]|uniref:cation:proton antiporter n=1 Tax=Telmatospirillum sp. J64-1 TaxID=2502183 RepID=UPI00115F5298|nr:cation:proton antiporter [Telmatospirillum sp. J64-1]